MSDFDAWYADRVNKLDSDHDMGVHHVLLDIVDQIDAIMEERGITQAELARRLGVSRARVSALLNGQPNTSVRTLMRIAYALDAVLDVSFGKPEALKARGLHAPEGVPQHEPEPEPERELAAE